jgi:hypothetical protein
MVSPAAPRGIQTRFFTPASQASAAVPRSLVAVAENEYETVMQRYKTLTLVPQSFMKLVGSGALGATWFGKMNGPTLDRVIAEVVPASPTNAEIARADAVVAHNTVLVQMNRGQAELNQTVMARQFQRAFVFHAYNNTDICAGVWTIYSVVGSTLFLRQAHFDAAGFVVPHTGRDAMQTKVRVFLERRCPGPVLAMMTVSEMSFDESWTIQHVTDSSLMNCCDSGRMALNADDAEFWTDVRAFAVKRRGARVGK